MVRWFSRVSFSNGLKYVFFILCLSCIHSHPDIYKVRPNGSRVIQPYSCHDPTTKEEGVCMFSWNCQRSNGTHLTYCMDRFYFGSCCKLPPGVYVATPPSIESNEVTEILKYKQRTTTQKSDILTTKSTDLKSSQAHSDRRPSTTSRPIKPVKVTSTEFPPGLFTWRPHLANTTTAKPFKVKPTKLFSTKPLFGGSTDESESTNKIEPKVTQSSVKTTQSSTAVSKRRTRPTRPHGSTNKRRTRPTKPHTSKSTSAQVTQRKTKPTRPHSRPTTATVALNTKSTIGTWSNILDSTTRPISIPLKTTPSGATTRRTSSSTTLSRRTTSTMLPRRTISSTTVPRTTTSPTTIPQRTTTSGSSKKESEQTIAYISKTTPVLNDVTRKGTRPTSATSIRTKPTKVSIVTATRIKPARPTSPVRTKPTKPSNGQTDSIFSTKYVPSSKPTSSESATEIITFPPFPGITKTTKSTTTTLRTRRPSLRPKPTTAPPTRTSVLTTTSTLSSIDHSTTERITPGMEYLKVCGRPRPGPRGRIVGGDHSFFAEWPWMVSLRQWKKNTFLHKCGATLLNEFWAITAAHCVENVPLADIMLRIGEYDVSHENEPLPHIERRVQIAASHPNFDRSTFEYDLALLRFYEPVTFQRNIIPACLPTGNSTYIGKFATVVGWGRLDQDGPLPDKLQEVTLPVITNRECEDMYSLAGFQEQIPDIFICAGYGQGGKDSCEGDSGGPMVIQEDDGRFVLAGVISWGIGCALPHQPGVYTRITKFLDWINQIIIF